jgi:hypothetical protein
VAIILVAIGGYLWLLVIILLMANVAILLMVVCDYSINEY